MRSRKFLCYLCSLLVLIGAVLLLLPSVRWTLLGRLRGESFYRGRPTSYWRLQVKSYMTVGSNLAPDTHPQEASRDADDAIFYMPDPEDNIGFDDQPHTQIPFGQPVSPKAIPVLLQLLADQDDQVVIYACRAITHLT